MPSIRKIKARNEQRIELKDYSTPEEKAFITIRKLSYATKKKIDLLQQNSYSGEIGKPLLKKFQKQAQENNGEMQEKDALEYLEEMNLSTEELSILNNTAQSTEKLTIEAGIDPDNHNFTDDEGQNVYLDYDLIISIFSQEEVKGFINKIMSLSAGISLGETTSQESGTP